MVLGARFPDDPATGRRTVTEKSAFLLEGFLLSREVMECTNRTLSDYKVRIGQFARFLYDFYPNLTLADVERRHIEYYLVWLKKNGRKPWTLRTSYRALHAFYRWMLEEDLVSESPLAKMHLPKVPKIGKPFLTETQLKQLLSVCPVVRFTGARAAAMIWLLWGTGMRFMELAYLTRSDLKWDSQRIRVFGKGQKERYVEFPEAARRAVWRYLQFREDNMPDLWLTEERTRLLAPGVRHAMRRIYERAGVKIKDEFHIFRRTWAMRKIQEGVPLKYIMLVGGWEDTSTLDRYVWAADSEMALDAMQKSRRKSP
ncbi:MAG: tyrosine-type recombinase/integrase [Desulfobacteraceae bacterium]|jgi:site-specific recombinase XerD